MGTGIYGGDPMWLVLLLMMISALGGAAVMGMVMLGWIERNNDKKKKEGKL